MDTQPSYVNPSVGQGASSTLDATDQQTRKPRNWPIDSRRHVMTASNY